MLLAWTARTGPTLIAALLLNAAGCKGPKETEQRPSSDWAAPSDEAISTLLAGRMQHNGVGMVVGVIDGERRSVVAHGISGAANGRPLDGATVFQLGSLTKVITGLLLADMVARGEVALDDPVSQFLPAGVFAGRYRRGDGPEWEVVAAGELLRIRYPDNSIFEFVPSEPHDFFYNAGNDDITFDVDSEGRVVGLTVYGDGKPAGGGRFAARTQE